MAKALPIALLVDDSCPLVHVFREHWMHVHGRPPLTKDGRPLLETIPNSFLERFCDVVEAHGLAGKFSVVPAPAGRGDVVQGIGGHAPALTREWLHTARNRLGGRFDFSPEMITHDLAVDLATGDLLPLSENDWSQTQHRTTLTPYVQRALALLRDAGIDCTGVTSPWVFGIKVELEYQQAIVAAQRAVYGREVSWYFLHMLYDRPATRPWVAVADDARTSAGDGPTDRGGRSWEGYLGSQRIAGETRLVSIPATVRDAWWATIDCPRSDDAWIEEIADQILTRDGREGAVRRVLDAGGWPVVLTHWQSLFSNGLETGLRALDEVARRINAALGDAVVWSSCSELMQRTLAAATD